MMKTNVKQLLAIAFLASACTTGQMVTSGGQVDDVYFVPGDAPPPVAVTAAPQQTAKKTTVVSEIQEREYHKSR